ncbi:MoaF C-terminal domain-containing protein [Leucobacter luti]|uniref:Molybdenum cofactor biosynthesis protein F n=1 Tax=Leucobacter luti TaxID=340320 RepID=A0A4Q7U581_9MICO|nr:MoaF C-terminal domain-containing protein [Leucobacter luti]MBL3700984.1 molybdenum cofactor biosynthesis protein MoaF [Leucobacter luti]RZT68795.1 molybdenum cofactor biosynthesis protein F [Leucobacter luti]
MTTMPSADTTPADPNEWRSYDEFAAGIDTFRLPDASLAGVTIALTLDDDTRLALAFDADTVRWSATGAIVTAGELTDPYDAVRVRDDVVFVHLPLDSRELEALTIVYSETTHRALVTRSLIGPEDAGTEPRVGQTFWAGITDGGSPTGAVPAPSRDLIGKRNLYRYSPFHLYEHVYMSSERYAWQCVQGVQRGHGDTDLSTVWKFADGLYLFCFREFRIAVASVWLHDLGYQLRTTGAFLGIAGDGAAEHSRAGGHIYPIGSVTYPDVQPV